MFLSCLDRGTNSHWTYCTKTKTPLRRRCRQRRVHWRLRRWRARDAVNNPRQVASSGGSSTPLETETELNMEMEGRDLRGDGGPGPYLVQCKWGDSTRPPNFRAPPTRLQEASMGLWVSFFSWWLYVSFFVTFWLRVEATKPKWRRHRFFSRMRTAILESSGRSAFGNPAIANRHRNFSNRQSADRSSNSEYFLS
jgi:hypothetical protein